MRKQDRWRDPAVARAYDTTRFGGALRGLKHRRDERLVLALLERHGAGPRVLDLPVGTGRLLRALGDRRRVVGADLSLEMMRCVPRPLPAGCDGLVGASAFRLPFASGAFGAAVSLRFLFHLDDGTERGAVLRELARVVDGPIIGQVRFRGTFKHLSRFVRSRVEFGARRRFVPSNTTADIERELHGAGLELLQLAPVSRAFSDKALFVARRREPGDWQPKRS